MNAGDGLRVSCTLSARGIGTRDGCGTVTQVAATTSAAAMDAGMKQPSGRDHACTR